MKKDRGNPASASPDVSAGQRVVDASMALFAERGYHGTGIRDIADRAGLSTATLYHYMGTKEDLLLHIMREANTRLVAVANKATAQAQDPAEQISLLARVLVAVEATHRLTIVGDTELRVLNPGNAEEILAVRDAHEQQWATAIRQGVEDGIFHVADEQLARFALVQMCTGVAHWYTPDGRLSLPEVATQYGDMALTLLAATRDGERLTSASMKLHEATVEIDLVMQGFDSFISPRSRPTHFAMVRKP
jgi:AcrR family transcriptional regulator